MSRTIKAIQRHMTPKTTPQRIHSRERSLVAEWQRGAEILGHAKQKLRFAFAPTQSPHSQPSAIDSL